MLFGGMLTHRSNECVNIIFFLVHRHIFGRFSHAQKQTQMFNRMSSKNKKTKKVIVMGHCVLMYYVMHFERGE